MAPDHPAGSNYATQKWWKEAIVYQIYPASFLSTGSGSEPGWGDIPGITSKLNYLKDLGIDIIWLSPIYKSPQADMGYDISDYKDIDPRYGTLSDVDELIKGLKSRGMKLMMDLVVNHTSDQHSWFLDSRSSKSSDKRDWYIWKPGKYDEAGNRQPPNNWAQILGKGNSAWTWDEKTEEYYLSLFTPEQPDLDWRNTAVRTAVHDVVRFWLERGVSGFRLDVINHISKTEGYPDAPVLLPDLKYQEGSVHYINGPHMHEYLREMRTEVLDHFDTITVGEMPLVYDEDEILKTVGAASGELNMIFIFDITGVDDGPTYGDIGVWTPAQLRDIVSRWQRVMYEGDGWNSVFMENHDGPRSVTRYVDDSDGFRAKGARLLSLMLTTLGGTLYVFQGQELGMRNIPSNWPVEQYKDINSVNHWKQVNNENPDDEKALQLAKEFLQRKARDNCRTPVQWNPGPNAGFCPEDTRPWMRVNDDYKTWNAGAQLNDSTGRSVLQFWRHGLQRRKNLKDVFVYGSFECLDNAHETVFAYKRTSEADEAWLTVLNFSGQTTEWTIPDGLDLYGFVETSYEDAMDVPNVKNKKVELRAWEGLLARLPAT